MNLWIRSIARDAEGFPPDAVPCIDEEIARRLCEITEGFSLREIASATGYHSESVRRYMKGNAKIPASFIAAFAVAFAIDPAVLLLSDNCGEADEIPSEMSSGELADAALTAIRPMLQAWFINVRAVRDKAPSGPVEAPGDIEPKPVQRSPSLNPEH